MSSVLTLRRLIERRDFILQQRRMALSDIETMTVKINFLTNEIKLIEDQETENILRKESLRCQPLTEIK